MTLLTSPKEAPWRELLSQSCTNIAELQERLGLSENKLAILSAIQKTYPLLVNPYYLSLINPDDPNDPIRRMCIPGTEELDLAGLADTSGEATSTVLPGLQHKYAETVLLLSTNQCAMYCRHCFRRRLVGLAHDEVVRDVNEIASYIAAHSEITNVLISGGDAFLLSNENIKRYLELLAPIAHLSAIRFGTRIPVVLPQRITTDAELTQMLSEFSQQKQLYVVTQFNHPAEITPESRDAVQQLLRAGVPVRNQTVLLKGVNDSPRIMAELMNALTGIGVIPYYVFQCRPTIGVKNRFQVPLRTACEIIEQTRNNLSGIAKGFRFIMSHDVGKLEILGPLDVAAQSTNALAPDAQGGSMSNALSGLAHNGGTFAHDDGAPLLFRFHQARNRENLGRFFLANVSADACWLDEE